MQFAVHYSLGVGFPPLRTTSVWRKGPKSWDITRCGWPTILSFQKRLLPRPVPLCGLWRSWELTSRRPLE